MFPVEVPKLAVYAGDTLNQSYRVRQDGEPVDLSAWSEWAAVWVGDDHRETLTVDSSSAAQGILTVTATPAQTRRMTGRGKWDLQGRDGEVTRTWLRGQTTWQNDVTPGGDV